jgi:hypothetical protein
MGWMSELLRYRYAPLFSDNFFDYYIYLQKLSYTDFCIWIESIPEKK